MQYQYEYSYDDDIRLNEFGSPDIDYYTKKARRLRAEAIAQLGRDLMDWIVHIGKGSHAPPMDSALRH